MISIQMSGALNAIRQAQEQETRYRRTAAVAKLFSSDVSGVPAAGVLLYIVLINYNRSPSRGGITWCLSKQKNGRVWA